MSNVVVGSCQAVCKSFFIFFSKTGKTLQDQIKGLYNCLDLLQLQCDSPRVVRDQVFVMFLHMKNLDEPDLLKH